MDWPFLRRGLITPFQEVIAILKESYDKALELLRDNRELMDKLAEFLIEKETITGKEFMKIFRAEKGIPEPEEEEKKPENSESKPEGETETPAEEKATVAADAPTEEKATEATETPVEGKAAEVADTPAEEQKEQPAETEPEVGRFSNAPMKK